MATIKQDQTASWVYDDGGRKAAGYKGETGDCGVRAIAEATGMDYQKVYDLVVAYGVKERTRISKRTGKPRPKSHPRTGIFKPTMRKIMADLGWVWHPTMEIGSGCTVHLRADELPTGRIVCAVSKHYVAVIDGVVHDTYEDDRGGTRCVYGYWTER